MAGSEGSPRRRLLAVDDSRLVLRIIRDFFVEHGYDVLEAENGRAALAILERASPDVIVADVLMPVMDGWALCEEVRCRSGMEGIPFVFLTVEAGLPKRLRGFRLGADDYVTKPFEVEELHARIERILDRRDALLRTRADGEVLLSGSVEHLAISDLLQILSLNAKDDVVHLQRGAEEGTIVFEAGRIVHAACGRAKGVKALFRMLGWSTASFRVLPRAGEVLERTIEADASGVLMDGLVSLDEWKRWGELIPPPATLVGLAEDARARLHGHPLSAAEFDVMARAKGSASVAAILEESPLPDADLAEALCTLLTRGVLRLPG